MALSFNIPPQLRELFYKADDRYNSGLFHFRHEKDEAEPPDTLTRDLIIDDKPLKDILNRLYYPESPYEFTVLPADILGQVYEQFLGKVIRLTSDRRAVVEDKPEIKKAGGVFYTPTYIVDYIVKNTVGRLLEGKTPKKVEALRILDPACGSGSFLLGAYQYLLDWHLAWYSENDPEKWAKSRRPAIHRAGGINHNTAWVLTVAERKRILLNNIYGVDIDSQAVEVTKLSLLLKVLEGETNTTLNQQLRLFHERALPDLGNNIKCGNSLIGPDYYDGKQVDLLDTEEMQRVNAFDWEKEFPKVFKAGGFDAVIGNPPYVRSESLGNSRDYFRGHFKVYHGTADLYAYFIEKGISLLSENGLFCYIVANKWMRANYGAPLRRWLKRQNIIKFIDFGDLPVFKNATTYPCILLASKMNADTSCSRPALSTKTNQKIRITQVKTLSFASLENYEKDNKYTLDQAGLDDGGWSLVEEQTQGLLDKIRTRGVPLGEYVQGKIHYGIKTGLNEAFVIDEKTRDHLIKKDPKSGAFMKPFLVGKDIRRYAPLQVRRYLIKIPKGWTRTHSGNSKNAWAWFESNFPALAGHLKPFEVKAQKRFDKGDYWWELRACDYYDEFEKPKIFWPEIASGARFAFDEFSMYANNKVFMIPIASHYLLGILNSSLLRLFIHSVCTDLQGDSYNFSAVFVTKAPIRPIDFNNSSDKMLHDRMVRLVNQMLSLQKQSAAAKTTIEHTLLQRRIAATDRQIDKLVYELYDLTEEEIKLVENQSAKPMGSG